MQICGPPTVEIDGERREHLLPGRQGRILLAYAVLRRREAIGRDEAVAALWADTPPRAADAALAALLSKLRKVLRPAPVNGLRIVLPTDAFVDIEAARESIHRAESALVRADWSGAWAAAQTTLFAARRDFLPGEERDWVTVTRHELDGLRLRASGNLRRGRAAPGRYRTRHRRTGQPGTRCHRPVPRERYPGTHARARRPRQRRRSHAQLRRARPPAPRRTRRRTERGNPSAAQRTTRRPLAAATWQRVSVLIIRGLRARAAGGHALLRVRPVSAAVRPVAQGEDGGLDTVLQVELGEDAADVGLDGLFADREFPADLPVAVAAGDEVEYFAFAWRERV